GQLRPLHVLAPISRGASAMGVRPLPKGCRRRRPAFARRTGIEPAVRDARVCALRQPDHLAGDCAGDGPRRLGGRSVGRDRRLVRAIRAGPARCDGANCVGGIMPTIVIAPYSVAAFPEGGGHFWVYLQYVLGLRQLGCDVYWLEAFRTKGRAERETAALATFRARMEQHGLGGKVLLYVTHSKEPSPE